MACEPPLLTAGILQERLQIDLLTDVELANERWYQREVKQKTILFYKQTKFNLMKEESEGYAKLIVALAKYASTDNAERYEEIFKDYLQSIVGYFSLDPNRVLDVCLDVFEQNLSNECMINVLKSFEASSVTQILAFKCDFYEKGGADGICLARPDSLIKMAAKLIKHKIVDIDRFYARLYPDDEDIKEENEKYRKHTIELYKKLGKPSLNATSNQKNESESKKEIQIPPNNVKFSLIESLLQQHCIAEAEVIIEKLVPVDAAFTVKIRIALLDCISRMIADIKNSTPVITVKFFRVLCLLGPHIAKRPAVMCAVCRCVRKAIEYRNKSLHSKHLGIEVEEKDFVINHSRLITLLSRCLMPGLMLSKSNFPMSLEVWYVLEMLPFENRFQIYGNVDALIARNECPDLMKAHGVATQEAKYVMRRITKDNIKEQSKKLGRVTHSSPLTVLSIIVNQMEVYHQMIEQVVESLKTLSPLSFDVLTFVVMRKLAASGRQKLKADGMNIADWMQSLSDFTGQMCASYPRVTVSAILQYLSNQLKIGESIDLLVLKELVSRMSGIISCEDLNESQISALSAGEYLRKFMVKHLSNRERKMDSLQTALGQIDGLQLNLLVLIGRQRTGIAYDEEVSHLKLVGELYDKCQETLLQYIEFCVSSLGLEAYTKMLPPLNVLVNNCKLEAEVVLLIYRPVLRHLTMSGPLPIGKDGDEVKSIDISDIAEQLTSCLPQESWKGISVELYSNFWAFSLEDLDLSSAYETEMKKLSANLPSIAPTSGKDDEETQQRRKMLANLEKEHEEKEEDVSNASIKMKSMKQKYIKMGARDIAVEVFLETCILRRCILSPADSIYSARFVERLFAIETPHFNMIVLYQTLFTTWITTHQLRTLTAHEAARYGRFMKQMFSRLCQWNNSEDLYKRECFKNPCFTKKYDEKEHKPLPYSEFLDKCEIWFLKFSKLICSSLISGKYLEIRNSFLVLQKTSNFPFRTNDYSCLREGVVKVVESEEREDLKLMARSYLSILDSKKSAMKSSNVNYEGIVKSGEKEEPKTTKKESLQNNNDNKKRQRNEPEERQSDKRNFGTDSKRFKKDEKESNVRPSSDEKVSQHTIESDGRQTKDTGALKKGRNSEAHVSRDMSKQMDREKVGKQQEERSQITKRPEGNGSHGMRDGMGRRDEGSRRDDNYGRNKRMRRNN